MTNWLSRAIMVNTVEEEIGEPSSYVMQFVQEWTQEREDINEEIPERDNSADENPKRLENDRYRRYEIMTIWCKNSLEEDKTENRKS